MVDHLINALSQPIDAESLAIFRCLFGFLMAVQLILSRKYTINFFKHSPCNFYFELFPFIRPVKNWMQVVIIAAIIFAIGLSLGIFYQVCAIGFFLTFTYLFLCDKSRYRDRDYLACILALFFCVADGSNAFSLEHWLFKTPPETIPLWNLRLFQYQFLLAFTFSGLNKFNHDWICRGMPIKLQMQFYKGIFIRYIPSLKELLLKLWPAIAYSWFAFIAEWVPLWLIYFQVLVIPSLCLFLLYQGLQCILYGVKYYPWIHLAMLILFIGGQ